MAEVPSQTPYASPEIHQDDTGKKCHDDQQKKMDFHIFPYSKQTDLPGVSSALTRIHIPTKTVWIVAAIVSVKSDTTSFWGKCMSLHIPCSSMMYI